MRLSLLVFLTALGTGVAPATAEQSAPADAIALQSQIRARLDAAARGDATAWAAFVADDCICGLESKAAIQKSLATRPPGVKSGYGELRELRIRLLGETAVARYRIAETTEVGDRRTSLDTWRTETYAKRAGAWILVAGADTPIAPEPEAIPVNPALLDDFVGRYQYTPGSVDTVTREGSRLFVQPTGEARVELLAESESTFFARGEPWRLIFVRGPDGNVSSLTFREQGQEWKAEKQDPAAKTSAIDDAASLLEEVLAPYRQLQALHYRAHFDHTFRDADGRVSHGESSAEYWATPVGFRAETEVDRRLTTAGFWAGMILTYDGLESRILLRDAGVLLLRRGETPDFSLTPSPVLLPIDFLQIPKLDCMICRPTLADIRTAPGMPAYLRESASVRFEAGEPDRRVVTLPAYEVEGTREITVERRNGAWFVSQTVVRDAAGELRTRVRFSEPLAPAGAPAGLQPARKFVFEAWPTPGEMPNLAVYSELSGEITQLELAPTFLWPEFSIPEDTDLAQTVVDAETDEILRAGSCKSPLPPRSDPFATP